MRLPEQGGIRFDCVRKTYVSSKTTVVAVDGVSLDVRSGEVVGLLGPNGAGKTTLLRMLGRLVIPDSGRVSVAGLDVIAARGQALCSLGIVLEGGQDIHDRLTPIENVEYFGRLMGMNARDSRDRGSALLERFGLQKKAHAQARHLSRGMRQALSLCVALVHNPQFLVMDEPTVGLDPTSVVSLAALVGELKQRNLGILITTHDLSFIQGVADRILIIGGGRILKELASPLEAHPGAPHQEFQIRLVDPLPWANGAPHLPHCVRFNRIPGGVEVACAPSELGRILDALAPFGIVHVESMRRNVMDEYLAAQAQSLTMGPVAA